MIYEVTLTVLVRVEANSPQEAERIAFKNGAQLVKSATAHVSAAMHARVVADIGGNLK